MGQGMGHRTKLIVHIEYIKMGYLTVLDLYKLENFLKKPPEAYFTQ